jgi:hypothetical protein
MQMHRPANQPEMFRRSVAKVPHSKPQKPARSKAARPAMDDADPCATGQHIRSRANQ